MRRLGAPSVPRRWYLMLTERLGVYYKAFVGRVAAAIGKTPEATEPLCRGRVWTGADAQARGLVTSTGGLPEALDRARRAAHLAPSEPVRLVRIAHTKGLLKSVLRERISAAGASTPERPPTPWLALADSLGLRTLAELLLSRPGSALARLPFTVRSSEAP